MPAADLLPLLACATQHVKSNTKEKPGALRPSVGVHDGSPPAPRGGGFWAGARNLFQDRGLAEIFGIVGAVVRVVLLFRASHQPYFALAQVRPRPGSPRKESPSPTDDPAAPTAGFPLNTIETVPGRPRNSARVGAVSPIAHRPSPIAHRPSPIAHPIAHRPSPIAHRPSPIAHRPSPIAHRPTWAFSFPSDELREESREPEAVRHGGYTNHLSTIKEFQ
jgi:hypothetical protein